MSGSKSSSSCVDARPFPANLIISWAQISAPPRAEMLHDRPTCQIQFSRFDSHGGEPRRLHRSQGRASRLRLETADEFAGGETLDPGFVRPSSRRSTAMSWGRTPTETTLSFEAKGFAVGVLDQPTSTSRSAADSGYRQGPLWRCYVQSWIRHLQFSFVPSGSSEVVRFAAGISVILRQLADEVRCSILPVLVGDGDYHSSRTSMSPSIWRRSKPIKRHEWGFVTRCEDTRVMRAAIRREVALIRLTSRKTITGRDALGCIDSGAALFRTAKPITPGHPKLRRGRWA